MENITDQIIENAIGTQEVGVDFDSHDIIFVLMKDFAREYVMELNNCLNTDQGPFEKLHTDIAKRMASNDFVGIVRKHGGKRVSLNCRGQKTPCQIWVRTS